MIKDTSAQDEILSAPKRNKNKMMAITLLVTCSALLFWNMSSNPLNTTLIVKKETIQTATVERGTLQRDIASTGKVVVANAPKLYSTDDGVITLVANPGDSVSEGQLVAQLHSPELINRYEQQTALYKNMSISSQRSQLDTKDKQLDLEQTLDNAKVLLATAKREQRRATIAHQKSLISALDFEKAKDELIQAKLAFKHAQKKVALSKEKLVFELQALDSVLEQQKLIVDNLNRKINALQIKAPVAGIIGNWLVSQKARISANTAVMTVIDLSAYEVQLVVAENHASDLALTMPVELVIAGNKVTGQLSAISPEINNNQVTVTVRLSPSEQLTLRQNQHVTARILLDKKVDVLMVRRGQFLSSGGGHYTYRIQQDTAQKITISTGTTNLKYVEITQGASLGDALVISSLSPFEQENRVLIK